MAYNIIEQAVDNKVEKITKEYVQELTKQSNVNLEEASDDSISKTETIDLINKSRKHS